MAELYIHTIKAFKLILVHAMRAGHMYYRTRQISKKYTAPLPAYKKTNQTSEDEISKGGASEPAKDDISAPSYTKQTVGDAGK